MFPTNWLADAPETRFALEPTQTMLIAHFVNPQFYVPQSIYHSSLNFRTVTKLDFQIFEQMNGKVLNGCRMKKNSIMKTKRAQQVCIVMNVCKVHLLRHNNHTKLRVASKANKPHDDQLFSHFVYFPASVNCSRCCFCGFVLQTRNRWI